MVTASPSCDTWLSSPNTTVTVLENVSRQVENAILRRTIHLFCKFDNFSQVDSVSCWEEKKRKGPLPGFGDPGCILLMVTLVPTVSRTLERRTMVKFSYQTDKPEVWSKWHWSVSMSYSFYCLLFTADNDVFFKDRESDFIRCWPRQGTYSYIQPKRTVQCEYKVLTAVKLIQIYFTG